MFTLVAQITNLYLHLLLLFLNIIIINTQIIVSIYFRKKWNGNNEPEEQNKNVGRSE